MTAQPGNMVEKYSQTLFEKVKIKHISGSVVLSFMQLVFIVCQVEGYRTILKISCRPLVFTSYKAYSKNKKRSETSLPTSFSA